MVICQTSDDSIRELVGEGIKVDGADGKHIEWDPPKKYSNELLKSFRIQNDLGHGIYISHPSI